VVSLENHSAVEERAKVEAWNDAVGTPARQSTDDFASDAVIILLRINRLLRVTSRCNDETVIGNAAISSIVKLCRSLHMF
jgi:hypothetical protein